MFANYNDLPAVSVPCGFDRKGLPVGLQFVSRPWSEAIILSVANEYQKSCSVDN